MALSQEQLEQQKKQAEELLFTGDQKPGFAKSLFFGHFISPLVFPFPQLEDKESQEVHQAVKEFHQFAEENLDPAAIDRDANIPPHVIEGLGGLGILGMTAPKEYGGRGFSQQGYCKIMEAIGSRCASTAVFVNAHHSIGIRALLLFGTEEQKKQWLPGLVSGEKLAAFALTEPQAGSDAANVQTLATPSPEGRTYRLNGEKQYITNGAIAQVLTVMARTPVEGKDETKVTAFLVTPDMPGFEVVEARMPKCGIRGTATARLAFQDMMVPATNILGKQGKGLNVALTVLNFGRTTFGASCTGAAKTLVKAAVHHANTRKQFQQTLGEFDLVKKKIAYMAAHTFAMDAMTTQCAAFIDSGAEDYMLETAMLKVFSTEALWQIVNDTIQIFGGKAYFSDQPYERMMRDARINQIGEGANDVLKAFIALVGMRGVGEQLQDVLSAIKNPLRSWGKLWTFSREQMAARLLAPNVPVEHASLKIEARNLGKRIGDFGLAVQTLLRTYREDILQMQLPQERIADAACDLYASACTLSKLDFLLNHGNGNAEELQREVFIGKHFLRIANRRIQDNLEYLWDNDDEWIVKTADVALGKEIDFLLSGECKPDKGSARRESTR